MIGSLISMLFRLILFAVNAAMQLAMAIAKVLVQAFLLLLRLLGALFRMVRLSRPRTGQPMAAPAATPAPSASPAGPRHDAATASAFTPRPMRPRPRR